MLKALIGLEWPLPEPMFRERLFVVLLGNIIVAATVGVFAHFKAWRPGTAFLMGSAVAFAGFFGDFLAALVLLALGVVVAVRIGQRISLSHRSLGVLGCLTLSVPFIALLGDPINHYLEIEPGPRIDVADTSEPAGQGPSLNVLLVVADTLRASALLSSEADTPNLDRLRGAGLTATKLSSSCNQTIPSHLSLLTGLPPEKLGMRGNLSPFPEIELLERGGFVSLAQRLSAAGWYSAGIAANPLLSIESDESHLSPRHGFGSWDGLTRNDDWYEYLDWVHGHTWLGWLMPEGTARKSLNQVLRRLLYPTPARLHRFHFGEGAHTTDRAISILADLKQAEQPWFLFVNYMDVHAPYLPVSEQVDPFVEFDLRTSLRATVAAGGVDAEQSAELERLYLRELEDLDLQLGRLLVQVEKSLRPTLLVFTSDHGEMFGEHGQVEHGGSLFNNELAIPLIMVGPGVPVGVEHNYSAGLSDLSRTIAELAGISTSGMEGLDLLAQTSDAWVLSLMPGGCSLRHGDYKAHFVLDDRSSPPRAELVALYDLAADPGEVANLSSEKSGVALEFQGQIESRLKDDIFALLGERELSWNERRMLERMGYIYDFEEE